MVCSRVFPVGGVPCRVNGTVTENCPPKACDAVLWNQTVEACLRSEVSCDEPMLMPAAGVNCSVKLVSVRVVEYPFIVNVKLLAVSLPARMETSTGGAAATANCNVVGELGVTSRPPDCVANEGVKVIEFATVPVCKRTCGP